MIGAIGPLATLLTGVLDRVLPKPMTAAERAAVETELLKLDWQALMGQVAINATEARHESIFVAGWRPFVGWVCGAAFAWTFVVQPMFAFAISASSGKLPALPTPDTSILMSVLFGMLGLGGLRTYEKVVSANKRR